MSDELTQLDRAKKALSQVRDIFEKIGEATKKQKRNQHVHNCAVMASLGVDATLTLLSRPGEADTKPLVDDADVESLLYVNRLAAGSSGLTIEDEQNICRADAIIARIRQAIQPQKIDFREAI